MSIAVTFPKTPKAGADTVILPVFKGARLSAAASAFDKESGASIAKYLKKQTKFKGNSGQYLSMSAPKDSPYTRIILAGLGDPAKLDRTSCENAGGKLYPVLRAAGTIKAHFFVDKDDGGKDVPSEELAASFAFGLRLRAYKFGKYKSKSTDDEDGAEDLKSLAVFTAFPAKASKFYETCEAVAKGVFFTRDLINEPPNTLYPESFAKTVKAELAPLGVEVEILDEKKMQKIGFHAALAVGMGSIRPPRIVVMRWNGSGAKAVKSGKNGPLAFVGKGVTFDTGGISIKPSAGMEDMKCDMAGAAAVTGLMKTLALRKSKADVVGIIGLAENMPSHMSYRPSDIIGSLSGKTIEVLNTDAEGRLVLADCLTYIQRTYKPRLVIDLATLTGAMMVALGYEYCGTFVNNDDLWQKMESASRDTGEKLWRMPLDEVYKKDMVGKVADLQNLGGTGRYGGACTAAGFLEHFIEDRLPWAHMDIAGTAWIKSDKPTAPKPAPGFGVRVLDRFIAAHYE